MTATSDPGTASSPARHVLRFALLIGWCGVVWYLSDQSDPGESVGFHLDLPDWVLHGIEYAVGGFLAHHAFRPLARRRALVIAVAFCVLWALLDEWHQSFVPGRDSSWHDVLADVVGTSLGVTLHAIWSRRGDF